MLSPHDMLCRFIAAETSKWSKKNQRPRPAAFKENNGISVWNVRELATRGVDPGDLAVERLTGFGQAHHTVRDYQQIAHEATEHAGPLAVVVKSRPEDLYVKEAWRKWSYAHFQVEFTEYSDAAGAYFRQQLSKTARQIIPPADG